MISATDQQLLRAKVRELVAVSIELTEALASASASSMAMDWDLLVKVLGHFTAALGASAVMVWEYVPTAKGMQIVAQSGLHPRVADLLNNEVLAMTNRRAHPVLRAYDWKEPNFQNDLGQQLGHPFQRLASAAGYDAIYVAPMHFADKRFGALSLFQPRQSLFAAEELIDWVILMAQQLALIYVLLTSKKPVVATEAPATTPTLRYESAQELAASLSRYFPGLDPQMVDRISQFVFKRVT